MLFWRGDRSRLGESSHPFSRKPVECSETHTDLTICKGTGEVTV